MIKVLLTALQSMHSSTAAGAFTTRLKAFVRLFSAARLGGEISFDYGLAIRPNSWISVTISRRT